MIVDPVEPIINHLLADTYLADLVGNRVASKHRYGKDGAWSKTDTGLTVLLDGGTPDIYVPMQVVRLETRAYAANQALAMKTWRRLIEVARRSQRVVANSGQGTALIYWMNQASGPSMFFDQDVGLDVVLSFFDAAVGESPI